MPKSYRIRTQPGVDSSLKIQLEQDFDFLEILSLKINQGDIYTRICSDYGVIVGRVLVNGGYGVPNAKVSVFIPISEEDQLNPVISELYPYTSLSDVNEDGYRYNLLPYRPSYQGHAATGTFPDREDVLIDNSLVEVYDKYYKFTVKTNESGDYMIFGVPTGTQTVVMDVDLSDIGCFSLSPQDLIRTGLATESQVNGSQFKTSTNLNELPQIITLNKIIDVNPLWGEPEVCLLGITRTDFDLTSLANVSIQPTAIFMGSIVSTADEDSLKRNCKPKPNTGNMCDLITGPGEILSIRQTINVDINGDPILEKFTLEQDGKVIDENGTWLINVPMNLDYITTNEFGEQVLSNDPNVGIPTKGKYRFKVRWQNEGGLQGDFLRSNYLIPNIREYGWQTSITDPFDPSSASPATFVIPVGLSATTIYNFSSGGLIFDEKINSNSFSVEINGVPYYGDLNTIPVNAGDDVTIISNPIDNTQPQNINFTFFPEDYFNVLRSYAFSLSWNDYADKIAAINCEDTFYLFNYNRVYTVASFIDRYKNGKNRDRHLGIKEITDRACQSENNKFPVNDLQRNFDFIAFVVSMFLQILTFPIIVLLSIAHVVLLIWPYIKWLLIVVIPAILGFLIYLVVQEAIQAFSVAIALLTSAGFAASAVYFVYAVLWTLLGLTILAFLTYFLIKIVPALIDKKRFKKLALPMISYPDCDVCECDPAAETTVDEIADFGGENPPTQQDQNNSFLANITMSSNFQGENGGSNQPPTYTDIENDSPEIIQDAVYNYSEIFSSVDESDADYRRGSRSFITDKTGINRYGYPLTEPYDQKLNSFNLRDKYFNGQNVIETLVNGSPDGAFKDQIMVLLVDWGVQDAFTAGDIVTFQNPNLSGDWNRITGLTSLNQFNTNSITGTTVTGTSIPKVIEYANPSNPNSNLTKTIYINQTNNDGSYRFPADMEYFQCITGMSVSQFYNITNSIGGFTSSFKFPKEYLNHVVRFRYRKYNDNNILEGSKIAIQNFTDYTNLGLVFLVRGVDPYTDRQTIEYNLTTIFGGTLGSGTQIKVTGQYKLNYPIRGYSNGFIPAVHNVINNQPTFSTNRGIFNPSFTFTPDTSLYSTYTNTNSKLPYYYLSTDKNNSGLNSSNGYIDYRPAGVVGLDTIDQISIDVNSKISPTSSSKCYLLPLYGMLNSNNTNYTYNTTPYSYYVGGGSFLLTDDLPQYDLAGCNSSNNFHNQVYWYLYSPSYIAYSNYPTFGTLLPGVNFNNVNGLVMRSDRLPTSTKTEKTQNGSLLTSFALHQNNQFVYYRIPDEGLVEIGDSFSFGSDSPSDNLSDSDLGTSIFNAVSNSFTCENMVSLKCYQGYGTNVTIDTACQENDKIYQGCYYLLNRRYVKELGNDISRFLEWKTRFILNYSICRGVFSHMFQNNWINGVLYMPSFNKVTTFDILGRVQYNYCDKVNLFNEINNGFFYRSSPYKNGNFIGNLRDSQSIQNGSNNEQIQFPTTIMDLGNRDQIISEICYSDQFGSRYLLNTMPKYTSYNDSSDLLLVAILSRILNSTWQQQLINTGAASVNQFFSRSGSRIDGDIAQSFSINSEYQINPFISGNYPDSQIYLGEYSSGKPVFGVFYDLGETDERYINKRALTPGYNIYNVNPLLQTYVGYPSTQEVPLYKWTINSSNTIFGTEFNNWNTSSNQNATGNGFYSKKYQNLDTSSDPYFTTPLSNPALGFITNFNNLGIPVSAPSYLYDNIIVGAPYHFYFGLKQGATCLNRFIKLYINTNIE